MVPSCQVRLAKSPFARRALAGTCQHPPPFVAAVEEKGLGKTHVSIFRAFDAALTRAASLETPSRHPPRRANPEI